MVTRPSRLVTALRAATMAATALLTTVAVTTQAAHDWSGAWVSDPSRDVAVVRMSPGTGTARGWSGVRDGLVRQKTYRIDITQTANMVVIAFPGGASNLLTVPRFVVGAEPTADVENHGEWWTQRRTTAQWRDGALELMATTFSGWWKTSAPDTAQPRATDFRQTYVLRGGASPLELLVRVTLTDEKGDLEYLQRFQRAP